MKILCWNVQGLGNPRAFRALRNVVQNEKPLLIFLSETRIDSRNANRIKCGLSFQCCFSVDRSGLGGGLMLLWRDSVDVSVQSFTKGHIDSFVRGTDGSHWRFTGFYGDPNAACRSHSWSLLHRLAGLSNLPWLIGGDFNEILKWEEKSGGLFRSQRAVSLFRGAVDDCNLVDVGFRGHDFTWSNRQLEPNLIQVRLDRYLCSMRWRALFPHAVNVHLDWGGSNHKPILMENIRVIPNRDSEVIRGRSRFHFEEAWIEESD
ncbi:hypothetical protein ACOSQ4_014944 [Xanthoceras sorbifolium]